MTSMPTYDSQESLDFSFVDTTTTAKIKPTPTASAMAPIVAQQDTAMTAPSSSTASANGPKSIRLMNTFQIPSPSPVTTAASTPRRIDTPRYSTLSTSNPVNKVNKVSYSFDDRDRIIPSVKMRTISHDEQVLKNTRKKRASSVDSSHGSSRTGKGKSGENTGRWTSEEHEFFLEGLRNYGKEWKKIAELIQTRTVVQIRTHAQKYFQKVAKARLCGGEDVPCTFKSTAMSTCPKKNGGNIIVGTLAGSNGTTAHIAYSTSSSSSSNANGGGGNPNQRKRKNNASLSNSKRTKRKPRSRTISCLADFGGINYHQINNDQLIKLDLFSATTQPAKVKIMKTGTSKYYQKKHAEQMRKEQEQMDGGTSPTTAMTDLFAGLDGSMGGLDFLNDDFTEYDFSSDQEESESDVPDSGASTPRSGTSTPPQAAADRISSASTTDDETTRNTTNKKKKNIHQHAKNNTNKKKKKKQKYGAAHAQPVQRSNPYARTFRSLHKKDTEQRMNNRLGL